MVAEEADMEEAVATNMEEEAVMAVEAKATEAAETADMEEVNNEGKWSD
jgi:hypothetical protein